MQGRSPKAESPSEVPSSLRQRAAQVRRFNRFYTRQIGLLRRGFLGTPLSLTQARVLYELAQTDGLTASELASRSGLDQGHLSRILAGFARSRFVERSRSKEDRRERPLRLTRAGRAEFKVLDERQEREVEAILRRQTPAQQRRLLDSMRAIEELLGDHESDAAVVIREPRPGDYGWVVSRHGALYAEEYGWNEAFEGFVAKIVGEIIASAESQRSRGWIAEMGGENAGCVFVVPHSPQVAQLRLLLVDSVARGRGLGTRLVEECIRFSRQAGYRRLMLWTNSVLEDAARIYRRTGFKIVTKKKHHSFGKDLVGETWELKL